MNEHIFNRKNCNYHNVMKTEKKIFKAWMLFEVFNDNTKLITYKSKLLNELHSSNSVLQIVFFK